MTNPNCTGCQIICACLKILQSIYDENRSIISHFVLQLIVYCSEILPLEKHWVNDKAKLYTAPI